MADCNAFILVNLLLISSGVLWEDVTGEFANQWAVYMQGGMQAATQVAVEHGFRNMGPVSCTSLFTCFIFILLFIVKISLATYDP